MTSRWVSSPPSGHVSLRNPSNPNSYFVATAAPGSVTDKDIVERDFTKPGPDTMGLSIDDEIYKANPNVMAMVFAQTPEVVAFTQGVQLRPVVNGAGFIGDGLPVFNVSTLDPKQPLLSNPALGQGVAAALGTRQAVLLAGHGFVMTGRTIYNVVGSRISCVRTRESSSRPCHCGGRCPTSSTSRLLRSVRVKGAPTPARGHRVAAAGAAAAAAGSSSARRKAATGSTGRRRFRSGRTVEPTTITTKGVDSSPRPSFLRLTIAQNTGYGSTAIASISTLYGGIGELLNLDQRVGRRTRADVLCADRRNLR